MKKTRSLPVLFALAAVITACGSSQPASQSNAQPAPATSSPSSGGQVTDHIDTHDAVLDACAAKLDASLQIALSESPGPYPIGLTFTRSYTPEENSPIGQGVQGTMATLRATRDQVRHLCGDNGVAWMGYMQPVQPN